MHDERHALVREHRLLADVRDHEPDSPVRICDANPYAYPNRNALADSQADRIANRNPSANGVAQAHRKPDGNPQADRDADTHTDSIGLSIGFCVSERVCLGERNAHGNA